MIVKVSCSVKIFLGNSNSDFITFYYLWLISLTAVLTTTNKTYFTLIMLLVYFCVLITFILNFLMFHSPNCLLEDERVKYSKINSDLMSTINQLVGRWMCSNTKTWWAFPKTLVTKAPLTFDNVIKNIWKIISIFRSKNLFKIISTDFDSRKNSSNCEYSKQDILYI